jgi:hypothetical protein
MFHDLGIAICATDQQIRVQRRDRPVILFPGEREQIWLAKRTPPTSEDGLTSAAASSLASWQEPKSVPGLVRLIVATAREAHAATHVAVSADQFINERSGSAATAHLARNRQLANGDRIARQVVEEIANDITVIRGNQQCPFPDPFLDRLVR